MEPFFIFCAVLVLYCGYLTAVDLLRDHRQAAVPLPAVPGEAARTGRMAPVRQEGVSGRRRAAAPVRQFPQLSRGTA